jgi:hypothetical protein
MKIVLTGFNKTILLFMIFKNVAIFAKSFPNSFIRCYTLIDSISIINESGSSKCCAEITKSSV